MKKLNSNQLKLIAIIAMTFDHLVWVFFPGCQHVWWVWALHIIGRLTAPIMWFFIAEGCFYTHDRKRYVGRLLVFAVISHFHQIGHQSRSCALSFYISIAEISRNRQ